MCIPKATAQPWPARQISRNGVLDAKHDQPWLRNDFRHPDLRKWAREHWADLVWAALTLGPAWIDAGRPSGQRRLGIFENWAAVIGGILDVADIPGFLANLRQCYAASDFDGAAWQVFLGRWWDRFRTGSVGVADLFDIALPIEPTLDLGDKGNEPSERGSAG